MLLKLYSENPNPKAIEHYFKGNFDNKIIVLE